LQFRSWILEIAQGSDARAVSMRETLELPLIADTGQVAFVQGDSLLCGQAAAAAAAVQGDDVQAPTPVFLLRVGANRYFAFNYKAQYNRVGFPLFDEDFRHIITVT
jgi:hypothetical protein